MHLALLQRLEWKSKEELEILGVRKEEDMVYLIASWRVLQTNFGLCNVCSGFGGERIVTSLGGFCFFKFKIGRQTNCSLTLLINNR